MEIAMPPFVPFWRITAASAWPGPDVRRCHQLQQGIGTTARLDVRDPGHLERANLGQIGRLFWFDLVRRTFINEVAHRNIDLESIAVEDSHPAGVGNPPDDRRV